MSADGIRKEVPLNLISDADLKREADKIREAKKLKTQAEKLTPIGTPGGGPGDVLPKGSAKGQTRKGAVTANRTENAFQELQRKVKESEKKVNIAEKRAEKIGEDNKRLRLIKEAVIENQKPDLEEFKVHDEENFTSFTFHGKRYFVTPRQGKVIKILYQACESGSPDVSTWNILVKLVSTDSQLRDTFRHTKAEDLWGKLIVPGEKKGFYRLNI